MILSLFIPFFLGAIFLAAALREKITVFGRWERSALSFSIGWGLHIIIMFILSLIGIRLTFLNVLIADLALITVCAMLSAKGLKDLLKTDGSLKDGIPLFLGAFFFTLIGIKVFSVFWGAMIKPIADPDLLECYTLAARMIFLNGFFPIGWPLGDETLFVPLSQAWPAIVAHSWDETIISIANPFLFISLLIIFYSALARYFKKGYALVSTFLLSSIPFLAFHAGTGYADFPQAFYYSIATIYLYLFLKEFWQSKETSGKSLAFLFTGSVLLGISVWVKRSGIYYAGIDLAVLLLFLIIHYKKPQKELLMKLGLYALIFAVIVSPWLIYQPLLTFKFYLGNVVSSAGGSAYNNLSNLGLNTGLIFRSFAYNLCGEDNWHLLGVLFASALLLFPRKSFTAPRSYLLAIIGLQLLALFIIFALTDRAIFIQNETLLNRLTLHFIPVILYFCADILGEE